MRPRNNGGAEKAASRSQGNHSGGFRPFQGLFQGHSNNNTSKKKIQSQKSESIPGSSPLLKKPLQEPTKAATSNSDSTPKLPVCALGRTNSGKHSKQRLKNSYTVADDSSRPEEDRDNASPALHATEGIEVGVDPLNQHPKQEDQVLGQSFLSHYELNEETGSIIHRHRSGGHPSQSRVGHHHHSFSTNTSMSSQSLWELELCSSGDDHRRVPTKTSTIDPSSNKGLSNPLGRNRGNSSQSQSGPIQTYHLEDRNSTTTTSSSSQLKQRRLSSWKRNSQTDTSGQTPSTAEETVDFSEGGLEYDDGLSEGEILRVTYMAQSDNSQQLQHHQQQPSWIPHQPPSLLAVKEDDEEEEEASLLNLRKRSTSSSKRYQWDPQTAVVEEELEHRRTMSQSSMSYQSPLRQSFFGGGGGGPPPNDSKFLTPAARGTRHKNDHQDEGTEVIFFQQQQKEPFPLQDTSIRTEKVNDSVFLSFQDMGFGSPLKDDSQRPDLSAASHVVVADLAGIFGGAAGDRPTGEKSSLGDDLKQSDGVTEPKKTSKQHHRWGGANKNNNNKAKNKEKRQQHVQPTGKGKDANATGTADVKSTENPNVKSRRNLPEIMKRRFLQRNRSIMKEPPPPSSHQSSRRRRVVDLLASKSAEEEEEEEDTMPQGLMDDSRYMDDEGDSAQLYNVPRKHYETQQPPPLLSPRTQSTNSSNLVSPLQRSTSSSRAVVPAPSAEELKVTPRTTNTTRKAMESSEPFQPLPPLLSSSDTGGRKSSLNKPAALKRTPNCAALKPMLADGTTSSSLDHDSNELTWVSGDGGGRQDPRPVREISIPTPSGTPSRDQSGSSRDRAAAPDAKSTVANIRNQIFDTMTSASPANVPHSPMHGRGGRQMYPGLGSSKSNSRDEASTISRSIESSLTPGTLEIQGMGIYPMKRQASDGDEQVRDHGGRPPQHGQPRRHRSDGLQRPGEKPGVLPAGIKHSEDLFGGLEVSTLTKETDEDVTGDEEEEDSIGLNALTQPLPHRVIRTTSSRSQQNGLASPSSSHQRHGPRRIMSTDGLHSEHSFDRVLFQGEQPSPIKGGGDTMLTHDDHILVDDPINGKDGIALNPTFEDHVPGGDNQSASPPTLVGSTSSGESTLTDPDQGGCHCALLLPSFLNNTETIHQFHQTQSQQKHQKKMKNRNKARQYDKKNPVLGALETAARKTTRTWNSWFRRGDSQKQ